MAKPCEHKKCSANKKRFLLAYAYKKRFKTKKIKNLTNKPQLYDYSVNIFAPSASIFACIVVTCPQKDSAFNLFGFKGNFNLCFS